MLHVKPTDGELPRQPIFILKLTQMEPSPQFKSMIAGLLDSRQSTVSNLDLIKHRNKKTFFYAMNRITLRNGYLISQTELFSDSMIIALDKGCDHMYLILEDDTTHFRRTTDLKFEMISGVGILHWQVENVRQQPYTVVKLMSSDGCVQLKLITSDEITQMIYSVCELPAYLGPDF